MKELNRERLREALNRLPSYDPPKGIWSAVISSFKTVQQQGVSLPEYSPPSHVWNSINQRLDQSNGQQVRIKKLRFWLSRAAAILLLFTVGYWSATYEQGPSIAIKESVEQAPIRPTFATFQDDDEQSFQSMLRELEQMNEPVMNQLRYELEELTSAKYEVEAMLVSYGQDAQVMNKLADIERERSAVYRQILAGR
ncbi:MAG: hypothetical protein AAFO91_03620 [Bacteroidota bacterium]